MTKKLFYRASEAQEHTALARSTFYAYILKVVQNRHDTQVKMTF